MQRNFQVLLGTVGQSAPDGGCTLPIVGKVLLVIVWQIVVPKKLQREVFSQLHSSLSAGHFGVTKTLLQNCKSHGKVLMLL